MKDASELQQQLENEKQKIREMLVGRKTQGELTFCFHATHKRLQRSNFMQYAAYTGNCLMAQAIIEVAEEKEISFDLNFFLLTTNKRLFNSNKSPLFIAATHGHVGMVEFLLKKGANKDLKFGPQQYDAETHIRRFTKHASGEYGSTYEKILHLLESKSAPVVNPIPAAPAPAPELKFIPAPVLPQIPNPAPAPISALEDISHAEKVQGELMIFSRSASSSPIDSKGFLSSKPIDEDPDDVGIKSFNDLVDGFLVFSEENFSPLTEAKRLKMST